MNTPTTEPAENPNRYAALERILADHLPGGGHILPHYQDGPYYLIVIEDADKPHWVAEAILSAYTPRQVLICDMSEQYTLKDACALPQFCADMLEWHSDEYELTINQDLSQGPLAHLPDEAYILAMTATLLGHPPVCYAGAVGADQRDDLTHHVLQDALSAAGALIGLDALTAALAAMPTALADPVALAGAVAGLFQAPGQH